MPQARHLNSYIPLTLLALLFLGASVAHASTGNIDSANKYAWGNLAGWVDFNPTNGSVSVTSSTVTGYAWSADDGWINLSPTNGGVTNDGKGNLAGFAWDELNGWISFQGVTIDSNGVFHGQATGVTSTGSQNIINFSCSTCEVQTAWHPPVSTTTPPSSSGVSGQSATGQHNTNPNTNPTTNPPTTITPAPPTTPIEPPPGETIPAAYPPTHSGKGTSGTGATTAGTVSALGSWAPSWLFPHKVTTPAAHATTISTHSFFSHISTKTAIIIAGGGITAVLLMVALFFFL